MSAMALTGSLMRTSSTLAIHLRRDALLSELSTCSLRELRMSTTVNVHVKVAQSARSNLAKLVVSPIPWGVANPDR
jgi:hypothetical protein